MPEGPGGAAVRLLSDRDAFVARVRVRAVQGEAIAQEPISTEGRYRHVRAEFLAWDDFNASFLRRCFSDVSVAQAYQTVQLESAGHAPLAQLVEDLRGVIWGRIEHLRGLVGSLGTAAGPSGSFERCA